MNKLKLYMRAVVVTALLVVGGLGIYKGRNLLSGQKSATTPENAATGSEMAAAVVDQNSPTAPMSNNAPASATETAPAEKGGWFSGWFGSSAKPKIVEGGKEIGPATLPSSELPASAVASNSESAPSSPTSSMMGKLKFGNPAASSNVSDNTTTPPATPPTLATEANAAGDYQTSPPTNEYAAAPTPPPAFAGYGTAATAPVDNNAAPIENGNAYAYDANGAAVRVAENRAISDQAAASNPGATVEQMAPVTNNLRDPMASLPMETAAPPSNYEPVPTNNFASTPVEAAPLETSPAPVELPRNDSLPVPPSSLSGTAPVSSLPSAPLAAAPATQYAPTTSVPMPIAMPETSAGTNRLSEYAPTRPPETSLVGSAPSPLETALPATPIAANPRYANEVPNAATTSASMDPQLQGPQTPSIVLEKFAPPEVQVGRAAVFEILVKNVGKVSAYDVQVMDEIPQGTRFQEANPQPSQMQGTRVLWKLGAMKPGDEKVIEVRLVPESEGEIGSVAQVSFQAQVGAKSIVTRPKLEIRQQAPTQVHAGENVTIPLTISNSGSGAATGVYLESDIPAGFTHPSGPSLEYELGTLRPGESKSIELVLRAEKAGQFQTPLVVRGEGDLQVQDVARIEVIAPSLQLQVQGPKKRFVERQSTHVLTIANPGTAPAKNVEVIAQLPRGFKFISADHQGEYDARQHAVYWALDELPPNSSGSVQLTTLPVEAGEQQILVEGQAGGGLTARSEFLVAVDAVSELPFTVADLADPIEVNSETIYEVRVANRGAKEATNVRISATFPNDVRPLEGDGAARATVAGQKVEFASIGTIAPGSEATVKISALGLRAGDHRIAITVVSDEHPQPVTREEGTRVYLDQ